MKNDIVIKARLVTMISIKHPEELFSYISVKSKYISKLTSIVRGMRLEGIRIKVLLTKDNIDDFKEAIETIRHSLKEK